MRTLKVSAALHALSTSTTPPGQMVCLTRRAHQCSVNLEPSSPISHLADHGWALVASALSLSELDELRRELFTETTPGTRCLLDVPTVANAARSMRERLVELNMIESSAVAVQAIAFDKTPSANWKVTWHQDVMFPFAQRVRTPGYDLPTVKDGIDYARPPREVLERMLAVRVHLDDCDEFNGPLRIAPGSHRGGILPSTDISARVAQHGETTCLARTGDALLLRPLLLHASSPAREPRHRRVLHIVYYDGPASVEFWHRAV